MSDLLHGTVVGDHWIRRDGVMVHVTQWDYASNRVFFSDQLWRRGNGTYRTGLHLEHVFDIVRKFTPALRLEDELRTAEVGSIWQLRETVHIPPVPQLIQPVRLEEKVSLPELPGTDDKQEWKHACQMDLFSARCDYLNAFLSWRKCASAVELAEHRDAMIADLYNPALGEQPE